MPKLHVSPCNDTIVNMPSYIKRLLHVTQLMVSASTDWFPFQEFKYMTDHLPEYIWLHVLTVP